MQRQMASLHCQHCPINLDKSRNPFKTTHLNEVIFLSCCITHEYFIQGEFFSCLRVKVTAKVRCYGLKQGFNENLCIWPDNLTNATKVSQIFLQIPASPETISHFPSLTALPRIRLDFEIPQELLIIKKLDISSHWLINNTKLSHICVYNASS